MEPKKVKKLNKNQEFAKLFNTISEDDFLKYDKDNRSFILDGHPVPEQLSQVLAAQAKIILDLELWKLLVNEMKNESNKKMFLTSETIDDLVFGKAMLYTLDVMERKLFNLSRTNLGKRTTPKPESKFAPQPDVTL